MVAMELYRPRSSSIPRQYHRIPRLERFSVTDAVHLKLRLQALDAALSTVSPADDCAAIVAAIADACQPRPFHETVYIDGSEQFYLVVKPLSRPDLIPEVYADAYTAVLLGRPFVNTFAVSDFSKGVDPTFSELRVLLASIDGLCETDLKGAFERLEDKGKHLLCPLPMRARTNESPQSSRSPFSDSRPSCVSKSMQSSCPAKPMSPFWPSPCVTTGLRD